MTTHWRIEPLARDHERAPLVVHAGGETSALVQHQAAASELAARELYMHGALLFRGFEVASVAAFRSFCSGFGQPLIDYDFASTPRSEVSEGVYTSTEYPPHQSIPLHSEQSYSRNWPMKIWFYCAQAAAHGGETPIADCREIYERISPKIRARFERDGVMYVRNYGGGLDLPWTRVFRTEDRARVEAYCREQAIRCEWLPDGELRTRQVCQASARHPVTDVPVWFNQAHLFHVSNLDPEVRAALEDCLEPDALPRNVFFGDGAPIEDGVLDEVRDVLERCSLSFPWQRGDVLMLDNMLYAHARAPFSGPRQVMVAMAEPHVAAVRDT